MNVVPWARIIRWEVLPPYILRLFYFVRLSLYLLYLLLCSPHGILNSEFVFALAIAVVHVIGQLYYPTGVFLCILFDVVFTGPIMLSMDNVLVYTLASWPLHVRSCHDAPLGYLARSRAQLRHPAINLFIAGVSQKTVVLREYYCHLQSFRGLY